MKKIIEKIDTLLFISIVLFTSCNKKSESKHYVVGEDFDEKAFIEEEMANTGFDIPKGNFVETDETEEDESVFDSCKVPDTSLFKYGLDKTGNGIIITDYTGKNITNLKFPDEIEEIPVVEINIDTLVFDWKESKSHNEVKTVVVPDSVKNINFSFRNWENLEHIKLSKSIEEIRGFSGCKSLKFLTIPNGVKTIGNDCFENSGIKSLTLPDSVTNLEKNAFENCQYLEYIKLSKSITEIPEYAFSGCASLISIDIPEGVKIISNNAFESCTSLEEINISNTVEKFGYDVFGNSQHACTSLRKLVLPDSLANSYDVFFELYLPNLEYLRLPDTLTALEGHPYLPNLKHINIPASCEKIASFTFQNLNSLEEIEIPDSLTHIEFGSQCLKGLNLDLKTQKRLRELGYEGDF